MAVSTIRVWDPVMRVVHWSIACLVITELFNEAGANPWHRYLGYAAGALVILRLAWGIVGTRYARLASIARRATRLVPYVASLKSRSGRRPFAGHNPLGASMALSLWGLILLVVGTGWMLRLDAYWGDEALQRFHAVAAYVLGTCAIIHVLGVLVMSAADRTNLVKAMITGSKRLRRARVSN
jgi:cytochrome b